ncbi:hypothetical protein EXIGLDRAFT_410340 [Exidia glandulosa HHB12029]|uniref:Uncharacterized protein n=1 Tax=Exidia glandulosa HHB12029 TaxID=1314781 RepID=A0A165Z9C0_EXIGL|nr:hypothetical protein EXIGLDRAFT_410340 [Exidia glandulosa HHB12029]
MFLSSWGSQVVVPRRRMCLSTASEADEGLHRSRVLRTRARSRSGCSRSRPYSYPSRQSSWEPVCSLDWTTPFRVLARTHNLTRAFALASAQALACDRPALDARYGY